MKLNDLIQLVNEMDYLDKPVADRLRAAWHSGYAWPTVATEFYNTRVTVQMRLASAHAACELRRVVEIWSGIKRGGVVIGGGK